MTARIRENPYYVLGLRPGVSRVEIEDQGQKLLGMLALGLSAASSYDTPVGPATRTEDGVRRALAELRDPERRRAAELGARLDPEPAPPLAAREVDVLAALGWRRPRS